MKRSKVIYIETSGMRWADRALHVEQQINAYSSQGYEIKAVHCDNNHDKWYVFIEKDV